MDVHRAYTLDQSNRAVSQPFMRSKGVRKGCLGLAQRIPWAYAWRLKPFCHGVDSMLDLAMATVIT